MIKYFFLCSSEVCLRTRSTVTVETCCLVSPRAGGCFAVAWLLALESTQKIFVRSAWGMFHSNVCSSGLSPDLGSSVSLMEEMEEERI